MSRRLVKRLRLVGLKQVLAPVLGLWSFDVKRLVRCVVPILLAMQESGPYY